MSYFDETYCPICNSKLYWKFFDRYINYGECLKDSHFYELDYNYLAFTEQSLILNDNGSVFKIRHIIRENNIYTAIIAAKQSYGDEISESNITFKAVFKYFILPFNDTEENLINNIKKIILIA